MVCFLHGYMVHSWHSGDPSVDLYTIPPHMLHYLHTQNSKAYYDHTQILIIMPAYYVKPATNKCSIPV